MASDRDTLELLRLYRALPLDAQQALLQCARLLHADPVELRRLGQPPITFRQHLVQIFDLFSVFLPQPRRRRTKWPQDSKTNPDQD